MRRLLFAAAALLSLASCSDGTGSDRPGPPATITVVSGDNQSARAGTFLADSVVVKVADKNGRPTPGVPVEFLVTSGGGFMHPGADTTDAAGVAKTSWRVGSVAADSQRLTVKAFGPTGAAAATVVVRATATAGPATALQVVKGNDQTGATGTRLADSLVVRVVDAQGNGLAGVPVTWTVSTAAGTVAPLPSTTGPDGTARVAWTLGPAIGTVGVVAAAQGVPGTIQFRATATSGFVINIRDTKVVADSIYVRATATAPSGSVARLTARVDDRQLDLVNGEGWLQLGGLAQGTKNLQVVAVSSAGDSAVRVLPFIYKRPPQVTPTGPAYHSVLRGATTRIDAECSATSACASMQVMIQDWYGEAFGRAVVATGTNAIHADVPVGAFNGHHVLITVSAGDSLGGHSQAVFDAYVESSPALTEVGSAGTTMWDSDGARLLYVDSTAAGQILKVRAVAGGAETAIGPVEIATPGARMGWLYPGGAVFWSGNHVYDWRGSGAPIDLGNAALWAIDVEGNWLAWSGTSGGIVNRRDLGAGLTLPVAVDKDGNTGLDVAANGDVAFISTTGNVAWIHEGARVAVTTEATNNLFFKTPVTDGTQVVYAKSYASGYAVWVYRGTGQQVTPIMPDDQAPRLETHYDYEAGGGWAAFTMRDAGGSRHVWTLSPDGTVRQATSGTGERIQPTEGVGPAGQVVFFRGFEDHGGRRYVAVPPYTAAPTDIGGTLGYIDWKGGTLYVMIGRTAFTASF